MSGKPALIDLALSKAELKAEKNEMACSPTGQPDPYPWGLSMRLEMGTLKKLGLSNPLPQVGGELHMLVVAKVTSVNHSAREGEDEQCGVGLQVTMAQVLLNESPAEEKGEKETPKAESRETPAKGGLLGAY